MNKGKIWGWGGGGVGKLLNLSYLPPYRCDYVSSLNFNIKHALIIFSNALRVLLAAKYHYQIITKFEAVTHSHIVRLHSMKYAFRNMLIALLTLNTLSANKVAYNPLYYPTKSLILGTNFVLQRQDVQMFGLKLNTYE